MTPKQIWTLAPLTSPAASVAALRVQCRVDTTIEDAVMAMHLMAATEQVEKATQRVLVRRAATLRTAYLPVGRAGLPIPGGKIHEVTEITIDGEPFTDFEVLGDSPARIVPTVDWPSLTGDGYPVTVEYTVGYDDPPADLVVAVLMMAAEMFARREEGSATAISTVPVGAETFIKRKKIFAR
jgi:uncharacterized phiE125 gp8 family phage protein